MSKVKIKKQPGVPVNRDKNKNKFPVRLVNSNTGSGSRSGWQDPNYDLYPVDLIGRLYKPGTYYQMRYSNPTISSIMNSRKNFLKSIEFIFDGEYADILNDYWINKIKTIDAVPYSLSDFIADVSDSKSSFGFILYEYHKDKNSTYLYPVNPLQVDSFIGKTELEGVYVNSINSIKALTEDEILLLSNQVYAGNWWGMSDLRPLVELFLILQSENRNFLQSRPLEKGIVYGKQTDISDVESYDGVLDILEQYIRGQTVTGVLDTGFDLAILQVNNGQDSTSQLVTISNLVDEKIRTTLWANLETLGISTHGSRALGEEFVISDQKKLEQYIEAELQQLKKSKLFVDMSLELGIPLDEIEITTPGLTSSDSRLNYDKMWELLKDGIITREDIGQENWKELIASLGANMDFMNDVTVENKEEIKIDDEEI